MLSMTENQMNPDAKLLLQLQSSPSRWEVAAFRALLGEFSVRQDQPESLAVEKKMVWVSFLCIYKEGYIIKAELDLSYSKTKTP